MYVAWNLVLLPSLDPVGSATSIWCCHNDDDDDDDDDDKVTATFYPITGREKPEG
jgi:hypothetical protein